MTAYEGVPAWYITISPVDSKSPICLYFASGDEKFEVKLRCRNERLLLIANNPVASARFFHFTVQLFIRHVLGVGTDHPGLFGKTSAYYGTVEQQGRLTLHLHLLLWISGALSPDEIRKRLTDSDSIFQCLIIEYLENAHVGEFLTGSKEEVLQRYAKDSVNESYIDPCDVLPVPPPEKCVKCCGHCKSCKDVSSWWMFFKSTVDEILALSNIHTCFSTAKKDGTRDKRKPFAGCLDNVWKKCKARFPRPTSARTSVDASGALIMKKLEPFLNTISPVISYLMRGNTDVTNLRSGTALKAVVLYVSDYITKVSLKTHVMFDVIHCVLQDNVEILGSSDSGKEKTRRLMTKVVNSLTAKMELGAPMVAMYLLGNPDHYASHRFAPFYWSAFTKEVEKAWSSDVVDTKVDNGEVDEDSNVLLVRNTQGIRGLPITFDYTYRGPELANLCLYDWVSRCKCEKVKSEQRDKFFGDCDTAAFNSDTNDEANKDSSTQKKPKSKKRTNLYAFLPDHPLSETHATRCLDPESALVPNFIGPNLPRESQGDRKDFCMSMLTLFKPYRTGKDLKAENQSWDEAYNAHNFTPRQLQLIGNFNLRYECLDARDDFHAQLRQGDKNFIHSWGSVARGDQLSRRNSKIY